MTDRLDLTNAFEAAGIERKAAEHLAAEIFDAIRENVATKADLAELRAELKSDIAAVRAELKSDIAAVRAELKSDIAASKAEVLKWMFAQTVVTIGGLAALFHILH
jgi:predicted  nucleic acid-binding Zn-ribbon protein